MADEKQERDYCIKHSIKGAVYCPECGRYMTVDEDGFYCPVCEAEKDDWWGQ